MSVWRRKALTLFPENKRNIEQNFSIYDFWFDYLALTREAHDAEDKQFLEKIYGFAEWCMNETSEDLWNSAAVCFYEHLFDAKKTIWVKVLPWISDDVIYRHNIKSLWEFRLGSDEYIYLTKLLKERNEVKSPLKFSCSTVYTTGEIYKI